MDNRKSVKSDVLLCPIIWHISAQIWIGFHKCTPFNSNRKQNRKFCSWGVKMKLEFLFGEKCWLSLNDLEISKFSNLHGRENRNLSNKIKKNCDHISSCARMGDQWGHKCLSTSLLVGRVHECNTMKLQYHQNYPQCPLHAPFPPYLSLADMVETGVNSSLHQKNERNESVLLYMDLLLHSVWLSLL